MGFIPALMLLIPLGLVLLLFRECEHLSFGEVVLLIVLGVMLAFLFGLIWNFAGTLFLKNADTYVYEENVIELQVLSDDSEYYIANASGPNGHSYYVIDGNEQDYVLPIPRTTINENQQTTLTVEKHNFSNPILRYFWLPIGVQDTFILDVPNTEVDYTYAVNYKGNY